MPGHPAGSTVPLIATFVVAQIGIMQGSGTFAALLPDFIELWDLSKTDAGWINGIYYAGYLGAVPFLVSLADRAPPRTIFYASAMLGIVSGLGFAFLAEGFWTGMLFRMLGGISIAGTYMPGLKMLSDHLAHHFPDYDHSRGVAFYTSGFGLGLSLSFFFSGVINDCWGWRLAFVISALGPLSAVIVLHAFVGRPDPLPSVVPNTHLLDFRPVLKRGQVMAYVMAYTVHNFELFAFRSWAVAFLVFAATTGPNPAAAATFPLSPATIIAGAILIGPLGSILGNELSRAIGRRSAISILMFASAALAATFGFLADQAYTLVVAVAVIYCVLQVSDSASITAGAIAGAQPGYQGATMAVHSCIGFMGSFAGPVVFGLILDLTDPTGNGGTSLISWGCAFLGAGLVVAMGPLFVIALTRADRYAP